MQEKERMEQEHGAKMMMAECWMVASAAMLSFLILSCQSSRRRIRQMEADLEYGQVEIAIMEMRLGSMSARLDDALARMESMNKRVKQCCPPLLPPVPHRAIKVKARRGPDGMPVTETPVRPPVVPASLSAP